MPSAIIRAEVEDDDPVADAHHEVHVVLDDEDRHAPVVGEPADDPRQLDALDRAQPGRRLVEQEHARMHCDRAGDRQQTSLAVRQVADLTVEVLVEFELLDRPDDLGPNFGIDRPHQVAEVRAEVLRVGGDAEVLEHRRVLEQLQRLERADHAGLDPRPPTLRDVAVADRHRAARASEAGEGVDQRRLAGTVGSDQTGDLPGSSVNPTWSTAATAP